MAKHYGEDLSFERDAVIIQKYKKNQKKSKSSLSWKPKKAIYAKVKDHDKVTASVRHSPLGASNYHKISGSKHLQTKDSEQGHSKLFGRITVIVFNVPSPYIYHFPKFSKIYGAMPLADYHPIYQIWACAHLFGTLIYSICIISFYFWWQYLKQKILKYKTFLHLLKSVNKKHTFFVLEQGCFTSHLLSFDNNKVLKIINWIC